MDEFAKRLVPDGLWEITEPLIPVAPKRAQGGGSDRIARRGIESSARLGCHRRAVERTIAWLGGHRRLTIRYERHVHLLTAFLALAAVLTCYTPRAVRPLLHPA